jgi:hypothetical protein
VFVPAFGDLRHHGVIRQRGGVPDLAALQDFLGSNDVNEGNELAGRLNRTPLLGRRFTNPRA